MLTTDEKSQRLIFQISKRYYDLSRNLSTPIAKFPLREILNHVENVMLHKASKARLLKAEEVFLQMSWMV